MPTLQKATEVQVISIQQQPVANGRRIFVVDTLRQDGERNKFVGVFARHPELVSMYLQHSDGNPIIIPITNQLSGKGASPTQFMQ